MSGHSDPLVNQFPFIFLQRITAFIQLGIDLVMVLDGSGRPEFKRNKFRTQSVAYEDIICRRICNYCGIPVVYAAGEGEAECSMLQIQGIVDYVFSEDSDTLLFGARKVIMYTPNKKTVPISSAGTTSTSATDRLVRIFDVDYYESYLINQGLIESDGSILFRESCILRALIQGGDYSKGVLRLGSVVAKEASHPQTGFTKQLSESFHWAGTTGRDSPLLFTYEQEQAYHEKIQQWRERLLHELTTNDSKFFSTKHKISINTLKEFPSIEILQNYFSPLLTNSQPVFSQAPDPPHIDQLNDYFAKLMQTDVLYQLINWMLLPMLVINIRRKCDKKDWYESVIEKKTAKHSSEILKITFSPSSYSDILRSKKIFVVNKKITKELLGYIFHQSIHGPFLELKSGASRQQSHSSTSNFGTRSNKPVRTKLPSTSNRSISEFFKVAKKDISTKTFSYDKTPYLTSAPPLSIKEDSLTNAVAPKRSVQESSSLINDNKRRRN